MSPDTPNTPPPKGADEKDISSKLKKRLLIAGGLVALALASIPVLDHFGKRDEVAMTATQPQGSSGKITNATSAPAAEPPALVESSAPAAVEAQASQPAQQPAAASPAPVTLSQATPPAPDTGKTPGVAAIHGKAPASPAAPKPPVVVPAEKQENASRPQAFKPQPQEETPPPPAPVGKAKPVGSSLGYKVQLGLFSSLANAQKLVDTLKTSGIEAHSETRVHVGPFRTRAEAEEAMTKLRQLGYAPLLAPSAQ